MRQTDHTFRLVVKMPKAVTHERRLSGVDDQVRAFLEAIEPLGPRVHALWTQLPASFGPAEVDGLAAFLRRLPRAYPQAVEVRHRAFFDDPRAARRLEEVLAATDAEWIPFDTSVLFARPPASDAERDAWAKKPRVPQRMWALTARPIVRYLGRDDTAATIEGWLPWLDVVEGWLREGRSPTMFIHTPDNADAPMLARRFHDEVRQRVPRLEPLPEPELAEPLALF